MAYFVGFPINIYCGFVFPPASMTSANTEIDLGILFSGFQLETISTRNAFLNPFYFFVTIGCH